MRSNELSVSNHDRSLAVLAVNSPAAAYVRTLTTASSQRSTIQAISLAAELLAPDAMPPVAEQKRHGNAIERFRAACELPWAQLRVERLGELRAELIRNEFAPATINRVLAAVRGVLAQAWIRGLIDRDAVERAKELLKSVAGSTIPHGKHLQRVELARLLTACRNKRSNVGVRDAALICVLAIGLRRAEVNAIRLDDYDTRNGRLLVRGKARKERVLFVTNGAREAVGEWLTIRPDSMDCPNLFLRVDKSGRIHDHPISAQAVYAVIRKRAAIAGIALSPHDLRRTFAGNALDLGIDLATVQSLMGHASPSTTAKYDRRPEFTKLAAMELVTIPFRGS